jgi:hypothetical protein
MKEGCLEEVGFEASHAVRVLEARHERGLRQSG